MGNRDQVKKKKLSVDPSIPGFFNGDWLPVWMRSEVGVQEVMSEEEAGPEEEKQEDEDTMWSGGLFSFDVVFAQALCTHNTLTDGR